MEGGCKRISWTRDLRSRIAHLSAYACECVPRDIQGEQPPADQRQGSRQCNDPVIADRIEPQQQRVQRARAAKSLGDGKCACIGHASGREVEEAQSGQRGEGSSDGSCPSVADGVATQPQLS